ncbi:SDR family NAD(P)-dependent oxidoreductase [Lacihabitans sp. LS3-19]|uniref:SDR family NAD(P)-dependent oxidoreductase n=1 Tax=Lacihabitans sp. LS3-19 TaxID=2487335 RepID=UPI0020CC3734|nr:SDR family NAD(P)-dependent oxidoreductase [Lacihabitans sp. LS3-19]MCP9769519.1 SDR family NAD(P)-dependent oxidoreductase [Lacihabitans sp. LS3-19]
MNEISILGCGWLGKPLALALQNYNYAVKGSATSIEKAQHLASLGIKSSQIILNPELKGEIDFFESEILIIAIPPKVKTNGEDFFLSQIKTITENSQKVKKIIFISSTSVYPNLGKKMIEEDADISHFLVKAENQIIDSAKNRDQKYLILRFGGLMGYDRNPCKYLKKEAENDTSRVNYIHQDDAVGVILYLLENNIWNETFNIVSPEHPQRAEIWKTCNAENTKMVNLSKVTTNKIVSVEKFLELSNYSFQYPDPLSFKYL